MKKKKMQIRHTFYPEPLVEKALDGTPSRKLSIRVNELIKKGLHEEKREQMGRNYEQYAKELENSPPRNRDASGISTTMLMSQGLFKDEDSNDEDLI